MKKNNRKSRRNTYGQSKKRKKQKQIKTPKQKMKFSPISSFAFESEGRIFVTEFSKNGCRIKRGPIMFGKTDFWVHAYVYETKSSSSNQKSINEAQNRVEKSYNILKELKQCFDERFNEEFQQKTIFSRFLEDYLVDFDSYDEEGINWFYKTVTFRLQKLPQEIVDKIQFAENEDAIFGSSKKVGGGCIFQAKSLDNLKIKKATSLTPLN